MKILIVLLLVSSAAFGQHKTGRVKHLEVIKKSVVKKRASNCEQMFDLLNDLYIHEKNWTKQQRDKYLKCNREFHLLNKLP